VVPVMLDAKACLSWGGGRGERGARGREKKGKDGGGEHFYRGWKERRRGDTHRGGRYMGRLLG